MASTTSTSRTVPPPGWEHVDDGLAELERLAGTEISEASFFQRACQQLVQWGCAAVAFWKTNGNRAQIVCYQAEAGFPAERITQQASTTIDTAFQACADSGLGNFSLPMIADHGGQGGATSLLPWRQDDRLIGAVQLFLPTNIDTTTQRGFVQMGRAVADLCALFQNHNDRRQWQKQCEDLLRWQSFLRGLQGEINLQQTAYKIAHDGRPLLACDRLAVVIRSGTNYRVLAVSGAEFVHRRAEVVIAMERLCGLVAATGEPFWYHIAEKFEHAPQIMDGMANYLDASPANRLGILPLLQVDSPSANDDTAAQPHQNAEPAFAVLVVEQFGEQGNPQLPILATKLAEAIRPALHRAWQLRGIPLLKFWFAWQQGAARTRWLSRGAIGLGTILLLFGLLFVIPAEVKLRAPGELQPSIRHEVFAPCDSVVTDVLVDHGDQVEQDSPLLQLRSAALDLEVQRVAGELETVRKQLDATRSERLATRTQDAEGRLRQRKLTADEEQFAEQVRGLEAQQKLLAAQQAELQVRSPAAGNIITWNARERLAQRPLRRGDLLLTVANSQGPWQVELRLPARQAARLFAAFDEARGQKTSMEMPISFALSTAPGVALSGKIREVAQRVDIDENGDGYVLVIADISAEQLPQRTPGAVVYGRVHAGRSSLAVAWFHEIIDAARLWLTW